MTETTTIRVSVRTRERLNALAAKRGTLAGDVVAELVEAADDDRLLAVPLTRTDFSSPLYLEIPASEGGLRKRSFAMPEQLRAVSHERLSRRLGRLRPATMEEMLRRCRLLLR